MRVYMKKNITAYSGKDIDAGVVYSSHNNGHVCFAKNYSKPRQTDQHVLFTQYMKAIREIWNAAKDGFKADMKTYAYLVKVNLPDKLKATSYALFVKLAYAIIKEYNYAPNNVDVSMFIDEGCTNVLEAINSGFLWQVPGSEGLTNDIN